MQLLGTRSRASLPSFFPRLSRRHSFGAPSSLPTRLKDFTCHLEFPRFFERPSLVLPTITCDLLAGAKQDSRTTHASTLTVPAQVVTRGGSELLIERTDGGESVGVRQRGAAALHVSVFAPASARTRGSPGPELRGRWRDGALGRSAILQQRVPAATATSGTAGPAQLASRRGAMEPQMPLCAWLSRTVLWTGLVAGFACTMVALSGVAEVQSLCSTHSGLIAFYKPAYAVRQPGGGRASGLGLGGPVMQAGRLLVARKGAGRVGDGRGWQPLTPSPSPPCSDEAAGPLPPWVAAC